MVWHSVAQGDKDEAALDMLGSVLSSVAARVCRAICNSAKN
jgi:hypothetical protein